MKVHRRTETTRVTIRPARLEDAAGIAKVYVEGWRTTYPGIVPAEYLASMSYEKHTNRWRGILSSSDGFVYVAEDGPGHIVGFIWGGPVHVGAPEYKGELHVIYVLKGYQGQHIGRRLVQTLVKKLLEEGIDSMIVWVICANPFRRFYERLGAKLVKIASYRIPDTGITLDDCGYGWNDIHTLLDEQQ